MAPVFDASMHKGCSDLESSLEDPFQDSGPNETVKTVKEPAEPVKESAETVKEPVKSAKEPAETVKEPVKETVEKTEVPEVTSTPPLPPSVEAQHSSDKKGASPGGGEEGREKMESSTGTPIPPAGGTGEKFHAPLSSTPKTESAEYVEPSQGKQPNGGFQSLDYGTWRFVL